MWNSSPAFHTSPSSDSALVFSQDIFPGSTFYLYTGILKPRTGFTLCVLSCISPEHQKAFSSTVQLALASAPTFLVEAGKLLLGMFHLSPPFSSYSVFCPIHNQNSRTGFKVVLRTDLVVPSRLILHVKYSPKHRTSNQYLATTWPETREILSFLALNDYRNNQKAVPEVSYAHNFTTSMLKTKNIHL